jgi:hypothetical protein
MYQPGSVAVTGPLIDINQSLKRKISTFYITAISQIPLYIAEWSLSDWENVCERLGIVSNEMDPIFIKFCNFRGCSFGKCPHLADPDDYLFNCL